MSQTTVTTMHTQFRQGYVDPRIFGGFLEHMGRAVYEGVYQPDSAHADADGYRTDVLESLRRLNMTVMRYPGGNFASGYHWQDGVGPREQRPTTRELAWNSIEPNRFGTDEYIYLCRKMGWTPMLTVNLGTGTPEEARNWVEYCNMPPGTRYANMRPGAPHNVKLWCLGNEMDGSWQLGHVPARQYAVRAQQAAKMMKGVDPSIELVVCGSSSINLPTYIEWDQVVLEYVGDFTDYISLHRYVGNEKDDTPDYLAVGNSIDLQIEEMAAVCRFVQAKRRSKKQIYLCFDEWNIWYKNREMDGAGKFAPHLIEEVYNLEDALVTAGFLNNFVRHANVVKIANLAQIVNVIAPLLTQGDDLLVQSIFYPFEMMSKRRKGVSLQLAQTGPVYESTGYGQASLIDASVILDENRLYCFLVNRSPDSAQPVQVAVADAPVAALLNGELLTGPHAKAANSWEARDVVAPRPFTDIRISNGAATTELPPLSFLAVTLELNR